jgi:hypothetical protein
VVDDLSDHHETVLVLYAGDYDPSGLDIERAFVTRLDRLILFQRVALDRDQVTEHRLPVAPAKTADTRTAAMERTTGEATQVELDALDPLVLVSLFTDLITAAADPQTWWERIAVEQDEAAAIRAAANRLT